MESAWNGVLLRSFRTAKGRDGGVTIPVEFGISESLPDAGAVVQAAADAARRELVGNGTLQELATTYREHVEATRQVEGWQERIKELVASRRAGELLDGANGQQLQDLDRRLADAQTHLREARATAQDLGPRVAMLRESATRELSAAADKGLSTQLGDYGEQHAALSKQLTEVAGPIVRRLAEVDAAMGRVAGGPDRAALLERVRAALSAGAG